jgi:NAD(P)-dependent dehydrogenase (short-subunit alcohol dehydrogenase family)
LLLPGDVTDSRFRRTAVERTISELGQLNILVNNSAYQQSQKSLRDRFVDIESDIVLDDRRELGTVTSFHVNRLTKDFLPRLIPKCVSTTAKNCNFKPSGSDKPLRQRGRKTAKKPSAVVAEFQRI